MIVNTSEFGSGLDLTFNRLHPVTTPRTSKTMSSSVVSLEEFSIVSSTKSLTISSVELIFSLTTSST